MSLSLSLTMGICDSVINFFRGKMIYNKILPPSSPHIFCGFTEEPVGGEVLFIAHLTANVVRLEKEQD